MGETTCKYVHALPSRQHLQHQSPICRGRTRHPATGRVTQGQSLSLSLALCSAQHFYSAVRSHSPPLHCTSHPSSLCVAHVIHGLYAATPTPPLSLGWLLTFVIWVTQAILVVVATLPVRTWQPLPQPSDRLSVHRLSLGPLAPFVFRQLLVVHQVFNLFGWFHSI